MEVSCLLYLLLVRLFHFVHIIILLCVVSGQEVEH